MPDDHTYTCRTGPELLKILAGAAHLDRKALDRLSRDEESGTHGARESRQQLSHELAKAWVRAGRADKLTRHLTGDARLATNLLRHRVRDFDAPPGSLTAAAARLVRLGTDKTTLDRVAAALAAAADAGADAVRDFDSRMERGGDNVRVSLRLAHFLEVLAKRGFDKHHPETAAARRAYQKAANTYRKEAAR